MRIDSHTHIWTLGASPFPHNDEMSTARPEYPGLVEDLIRFMDLNNIDRTVLIVIRAYVKAVSNYDTTLVTICAELEAWMATVVRQTIHTFTKGRSMP